jgi:hypothetical protein
MFEQSDSMRAVLDDLEQLSLTQPTEAPPSGPGKPPEPPIAIIERERQPRKESRLTYKRLQVPGGVEVSVTARPGWVLEEIRKLTKTDGTDDVLTIVTRRTRGRPSKQQTNGSGDGDHG